MILCYDLVLIETFHISGELEGCCLKIFRHTTRGCDVASGDIICDGSDIKDSDFTSGDIIYNGVVTLKARNRLTL